MKVALILIMYLSLLACTEKENPPAQAGVAAGKMNPASIPSREAPRQPGAIPSPAAAVEPKREAQSTVNDAIVAGGDGEVTITVVDPHEHELSEADRTRLVQERDRIEVKMQDIAKEYDQNLDNPEKRKMLEAKMQQETSAYKDKVLGLVKAELSTQKP